MIEDSRNKIGTLLLDAQPFHKQTTSVSLEPSEDNTGEALETLSGDTEGVEEVTSWVLNLGVIQDFNDPAGIVEFSRLNAGEEVAFQWQPNAVGAPTYTGIVKVRALTIGGDVASRLTSTKAWPVTGQPSADYPTP